MNGLVRLCFRRLYGNGGKLSKPNVLDGLVEERVGNIAHVALVVNIYESESGVVDGQLDDDSSTAASASSFGGETQSKFPHAVVQFRALLWVFHERGQQLFQVLRQRSV